MDAGHVLQQDVELRVRNFVLVVGVSEKPDLATLFELPAGLSVLQLVPRVQVPQGFSVALGFVKVVGLLQLFVPLLGVLGRLDAVVDRFVAVDGVVLEAVEGVQTFVAFLLLLFTLLFRDLRCFVFRKRCFW